MTAYKLGRRSAPFARYALLLFDDRLEEVSFSITGLEVKRFFFDEAEFMTVHRVSNLGEVGLSVLTAVLMALLVKPFFNEPVAAWIFGTLAALMLALAVVLLLRPRYKLVLAAPSPDTVECLVSRWHGRREEALSRLTRAIVRHQSRTARTPARAPAGSATGPAVAATPAVSRPAEP